jgi:hypothetical protein
MSQDQPEIIAWEEPPVAPWGGKKRKPSKWAPIADKLRANPGRWAKIVSQGNISIASAILKGQPICFRPEGSFESKVANMVGRYTGDVYARYVGEHGEHR